MCLPAGGAAACWSSPTAAQARSLFRRQAAHHRFRVVKRAQLRHSPHRGRHAIQGPQPDPSPAARLELPPARAERELRRPAPPQTMSFRANAFNSRGIVGAGNPGRLAPTSWWSWGDSNPWPSPPKTSRPPFRIKFGKVRPESGRVYSATQPQNAATGALQRYDKGRHG
jgi:hypothetical protein